jgi:hypothetical protein
LPLGSSIINFYYTPVSGKILLSQNESSEIEHFISALAISVEFVPTPPPSAQTIEELAIWDVNDRGGFSEYALN